MSATELQAAHTRLANRSVLLNERAQCLSIATGSVDAVVSHLALMLMSDIEQVLEEIHQVLAKGGQLSAIVGRAFLLGEPGQRYLQALRAAARRDQLRPLPWWIPVLSHRVDGGHCWATASPHCNSRNWTLSGRPPSRSSGTRWEKPTTWTA